MSKTSTDLLSIDSSRCSNSCDAKNSDGEGKIHSRGQSSVRIKSNQEPRPGTLDGNDRSDHYIRLLKETQQSVSNRDVLIAMLQSQLKKMEDLYKKSLDDQQDVRLKYSAAVQELTNLKIIYKRIEEENERLTAQYRMASEELEQGRHDYKAESEKWKKEYDELSKTLVNMKNSTSAMKLLLHKESVQNENTCVGLLIEHCKNIENLLSRQNEKLNAFLYNINSTKAETSTKDPVIDDDETHCCDDNSDTSLKLSLNEANREIARLKEMLSSKASTRDVSCTTSDIELRIFEPEPETMESCCDTHGLELKRDLAKKTSLLTQETQTDVDVSMTNEAGIGKNKFEKSEKEKLEMAKKIKELEYKATKLDDDHKADLKKLNQIEQSKQSLEGKLVLLNQTLDQYKEQAKLSKTEVDQWMSRVAELEATLASVEKTMEERDKGHGSQMEKNKAALFELSAKYDLLRKEHNEILENQQGIDVLKQENANLLHEIKERGGVINSLRRKVCALECELDDLRQQMLSHSKRALQDIEELQNTCCNLETQLIETQNNLQIEEEKSLQETQETMVVQKHIEQLEGMKQVHSKVIDQQRDEIDRLKKQLVNHVGDVNVGTAAQRLPIDDEIIVDNQSNIEINKLRKQNESLQRQIGELKKEAELRKNNEKKAHFEMENAISEKNHLQQEVSTLAAVKKENESLTDEIAQLKDDVSKLKESHKDAASLDRKNKELFLEIENMRTEMDSYKKRLENANQELQEEVRKREADGKSSRGILATIQEADEASKVAEKCECALRIPKPSSKIAKACCNTDFKVDAHFTVLYNNQKYNNSSNTDDGSVGSSRSSVSRGPCENKFERLHNRLTSINQMEKQVESMIVEVRQQNEKLHAYNLARLQHEKDTEQRLLMVKLKRESLMTDLNFFQNDIKGKAPQAHKHLHGRTKHADKHSSCCPHIHSFK